MLLAVRDWFRKRWFLGVFASITLLWGITYGAYVVGAGGITVRNELGGQQATIDFMREYDHPVVELRDGVGLELDANGSQLTGTIVKLEPAPIGLCWLCGRNDTAGGIARVAYRQGDWLFRAPEDPSSNDEVLRGASPESRDYILTLAYNRATGERVISEPSASVAAQTRLLAARGLAVAASTRLASTAIEDLGRHR